MTCLSILLLALSLNLSSAPPSAETDTVAIFYNESYLEFDQDYIVDRNISVAFNPVNDHVYAYDLNSNGVLWEFKPDGSVSAIDKLEFQEVSSIMPIDITNSGESLWLWEQGLGKVFKYSFSDSSLRQIDQTRVQDLMFGHGSVITKDERILAIGGYGLWEFRNFLLEFTPDNGEWNKIETNDELLPKPFVYNFLGYLEKQNMLIYIYVPLSAVELGGEDRGVRIFEPLFDIYTLDLETKRWTYVKRLFPSETDFGFRNRPRSRSTHSIDKLRGIFVFGGRLALDVQTYDFYYISHPTIDDMWTTNFFYSKNSDRWVVIGRDYKISKQHMVVRSFPASEARLTPVDEDPADYMAWLGWLLGGFFSLALVYLGISKWKNGNDEEDNASTKTITLTEKSGALSVAIGNENIDLSDSVLRAFFATIHELKKQGQSEILMSEFDNRIFTDQHSQPFRSKIKKKIFKLVNGHFDRQHPFITTESYPLDKRYKLIVVDLESISIDRPKNASMTNGVKASV
jgi:hypothetical protein